LRIAQHLLARRRDVTFLLVGDGPLRPAIKERVVATGLGTSFRFLGNRDDVSRLLAASDVFVFPSLWEGLPGAVLEALAAGLPVAASPLPGVVEIARRTSGVMTVDPGDPSAFARTIETLLDERTGAPERPLPLLPLELTAEFSTARLLACYGAAPAPEATPIGHTEPSIDARTRADAVAPAHSASAHVDVQRLGPLGRSDTPSSAP
jgi:glycosyltransferase involved in cell wall biosynthesis